ncbi:MAG TPA: hypothetical protein VIP51_01770 [Eoetvoesiella sp.]
MNKGNVVGNGLENKVLLIAGGSTTIGRGISLAVANFRRILSR